MFWQVGLSLFWFLNVTDGELALGDFLGEEVHQPLTGTTQNIPQAFRNFCNLTLLHPISTPSDPSSE